jgi:hypothetical protein
LYAKVTALGFSDAGLAAAHEPTVVQFPKRIAIAVKPLIGHVLPLILEADGDAVFAESPTNSVATRSQACVPTGGDELDDRRAANDELVAIASHGVLRVAQANAIGVPGVPSILCCLDFLQRTGHVEGRKCGPSSDTLAAFVIG